MSTEKNNTPSLSNQALQSPFKQTYFHGTKANLALGDLIDTGINSNYGQRNTAKYIYLTATLDAAIWGAELALGEGPEPPLSLAYRYRIASGVRFSNWPLAK